MTEYSTVDVVVRTAGGGWLITDAAEWRRECSGPPSIAVLCSADTDE